jgi:hypothetical protein
MRINFASGQRTRPDAGTLGSLGTRDSVPKNVAEYNRQTRLDVLVTDYAPFSLLQHRDPEGERGEKLQTCRSSMTYMGIARVV